MNRSIVPSALTSHFAAAASRSKVAIYKSTSRSFMVSFMSCLYADCVFSLSFQADLKAASNSSHKVSEVSGT